jgi:hypothetical protein
MRSLVIAAKTLARNARLDPTPMTPQRMHTMRGLTPEPARIRVSCCGRAEASAATPPDSILPICSGGIDATNLALNLSPSLKGTPEARRLSTTAMRASCIEGASMMTILATRWRA